MQYSFIKINTVAACDILLASAQRRKQTLERKRRNLGESIEEFEKRLDAIGKETASVQIMLEALTAAYHSLPEGGRDKVSMNVEVKRLELRKARLDKKAFTCNVRALLSKQINYNKLDSQVAVVDDYIAAVQNMKAALSGAALRVNRTAASMRPSVVRQKSRAEKRAYNTQGHFSSPLVVHQKQGIEKTVFIVPHFGLTDAEKPLPSKMDSETTRQFMIDNHLDEPLKLAGDWEWN